MVIPKIGGSDPAVSRLETPEYFLAVLLVDILEGPVSLKIRALLSMLVLDNWDFWLLVICVVISETFEVYE